MFVMAWDVVSGYTGQISFGHSVFFAVGGFTSALLNLNYGLTPFLSIPAGVVLATVVGLLVGIPVLRLRGPYLSLVTLILPLVMLQMFNIFSETFTGLGSPDPLFGIVVTRNESGAVVGALEQYYLGFVLFLLVLMILLAVTRSDAGRVFTAIRESEDAVDAAGLNPAKFKIFAFALSAGIGGFAGATFVHTVGTADTQSLLVLTVNIEIIIAAIIGGMGTIVGAALGGMFFFIAAELFSGVGVTVPLIGQTVGDLSLVLFALLSLLLIYFLPGGLLRGGIVGGQRLLNRDSDVATDGGQDRTPLEQVLDTYDDFFGGDDDER
jgi:branched-chain amino acid transport system permease protein